MKTITFSLLTLLAGFAATAARAEHRVHVGIHVNSGPAYGATVPTYYPPAPVVVAPTYSPVYNPVVVAPRGYWQDVTVKTWIPGRWTHSRDRWGRPVRVFEPAHYAYTTNRVWVDGRDYRHDHRSDRDYNRHDNRGGRWGR
jgi:hypothetical protein